MIRNPVDYFAAFVVREFGSREVGSRICLFRLPTPEASGATRLPTPEPTRDGIIYPDSV